MTAYKNPKKIYTSVLEFARPGIDKSVVAIVHNSSNDFPGETRVGFEISGYRIAQKVHHLIAYIGVHADIHRTP